MPVSEDVEILPTAAAQPATPVSPEAQDLRVESHGLSKMSAFALPSTEELMASDVGLEMREKIASAAELTVFQTADEFALRYMKEVVIPALGLDDRQQQAAVRVVERKNFSSVKPDERQAFMQLSHQQERISHMLIKYMIGPDNVESRGFRPLETAELHNGMAIAEEMDQLYMKWEKEKHDIAATADREARGFKSRWHYVKGSEETGYGEVPYSEVFPEEHARISELLGKMVDELIALRVEGEEDPDLESKIKLYQAWKAAHDTSDAHAVADAWTKAEIAYTQQQGRIITITPQEYGYAANETGIIPEISLRFKLGAGENPMAVGIRAKKEQMQNDLPAVFADMPHAQQSVSKIPLPELSYFAVNGGSNLVFQVAGQALPNTDRIRNEYGSVTTTNAETMRKRIEEAKSLFREIFGSKFDAELDAIDMDEVIVNVGVHEMGHNVGDKDTFRTSLQRNGMEEWKASATEWALMHMDASLTDEQLRSAMLAEILHAMRYTEKRDDPTSKPYYTGWLYFMKTAQELGIIQQSGEAFDLDLSPEKVKAFAATINQQWLDLQGLYEDAKTASLAKDDVALAAAQTRADSLYAQQLVETPFIKATQEICARRAA